MGSTIDVIGHYQHEEKSKLIVVGGHFDPATFLFFLVYSFQSSELFMKIYLFFKSWTNSPWQTLRANWPPGQNLVSFDSRRGLFFHSGHFRYRVFNKPPPTLFRIERKKANKPIRWSWRISWYSISGWLIGWFYFGTEQRGILFERTPCNLTRRYTFKLYGGVPLLSRYFSAQAIISLLASPSPFRRTPKINQYLPFLTF